MQERTTSTLTKTTPNWCSRCHKFRFFLDPSALNSCQKRYCDRMFSGDSSKMQSFRDSTRRKRERWLTFRHRVPFRETQSDNLKCPWFDFTNMENKGQEVDIVALEIRSIEPIEKHVRKKRFEAVAKNMQITITSEA